MKIKPQLIRSFKEKLSILYNYTSKIIVAHLNINSQREKFDSLLGQIIGNIEILMVSKLNLTIVFWRVSLLLNFLAYLIQ